MHCFEELGYDETTTAVIAKRAGIAVGTLYGYFQNKGDILAEVVEQTLGEVTELIVESLEPAVNRTRDPREVVRSLIDTIFHIQTIRPGTQRVIYERYFKDDAFRGVVEQRQDYTRKALVRFIESIDGSYGLRDVDPETAAWVIFNAVQWNATQAMVTREHDPRAVDAAANAAGDMIVRYLFE